MDARSGFVFSCSPCGAHSNWFQIARQPNNSHPLIAALVRTANQIQKTPDPNRLAQASDGSPQNAREAVNDRA